MKKRISFLFMVLLIFAFSMNVYAQNKTVNPDFSVTLTTTTCTVSGTTGTPGSPDTYALAVAIQIRDVDNKIVAMATTGTSAGAFNTTITGLSLTAGATYKIYIADYEGGDWATPVSAIAVGTDNQPKPDEGGNGGNDNQKGTEENKSESTKITSLVVPATVTYENATTEEMTDLVASTVISLYDSKLTELKSVLPTYDAATGNTTVSFKIPVPAVGEMATYYIKEAVQPTSLGYGLASDKEYIVYATAFENGKVAMAFVDAATGLEVQNIVFENQRLENLNNNDTVPVTGDSFWLVVGITVICIIIFAAGTIIFTKRSK